MTYNLMNQHGATLHDKALNGLYYFQLNLDALCEKLGVPYLSEYVDDYAFRQEMLASGDYDDLIEEIGGDPNDLLDPEAWHDPAALGRIPAPQSAQQPPAADRKGGAYSVFEPCR